MNPSALACAHPTSLRPACTVVLVSPLPPPLGGHAVWTQEFLEGAKNHGIEARLVDTSPGGTQTNAHSRLRVARVQQMMASAHQLWKELPDANVAHLTTTWFWSLIREGVFARLCRLRGVPTVLHVHAATIVVDSLVAASKVKRSLLRWWLSPVSAFAVLSDDLAVALRSVFPDHRIEVIPNWVDNIRFAPRSGLDLPASTKNGPDFFTVLFVGRLTAEKGFLDLGRAVLENRELRLVTIGDRPQNNTESDAKAVDNMLRDLRVSGRHEMLPSVPHSEMAAFYRTADVFALPSWNEGLPISMLEAMSSGLPCVVTPVGGIGDLIAGSSEEPFCLVVPVGDFIALAKAFNQLSRDANLSVELGNSGRRIVRQRFSRDTAFAQLNQLYSNIRKPARLRSGPLNVDEP